MLAVNWLLIGVVAYFAALFTGIIMSFTTRQESRRWNIRMATIILSTPICLVIAAGAFLRFVVFKQPPTLSQLRRSFPSKQGDLELILLMSNQDVNFSRIAPDFLDIDCHTCKPSDSGRYMAGDPRAALSTARWDEYRKIYSRNGIKNGIQRDPAGDAFIMVDSVGILNRGHTSGYLYCTSNAPANAHRFEPCNLRQEKGKREFNPELRECGYSFRRIDDRWYAYDEGPW